MCKTALVNKPNTNPKVDAYIAKAAPFAQPVLNHLRALVHKACLELNITHIESLCNLEVLIGQGEFRFIGLPLKWRGGTGSPIRAVAVFEG